MLSHALWSYRNCSAVTYKQAEVRDLFWSKLVAFMTLADVFQDIFGPSFAERALGGK
jgi:hypothetical protein